jgi:hypothetical protein
MLGKVLPRANSTHAFIVTVITPLSQTWEAVDVLVPWESAAVSRIDKGLSKHDF